jgi:hypothetical protein
MTTDAESPPPQPPTPAPEPPPPAHWSELDDEQLLEKRIRHLGLSLDDWQPQIRQLHDELTANGLAFHPPCFIGDEWFCPVGIPAIYVPFFLTHERLRRLERKMMLDVEGESGESFMKLLRHEAGHAYAFAYQLFRRKKWRDTFGRSDTEETPGTYRPRPYSRSYVVHLPDWYAQSHPDEDFAETFAVWLAPDSNWRERYRGWRALHKLERLDEMMRAIAGKPPVHNPSFNPVQHDCLNIKLKTLYARKRKLYEESYPDFLDADLRRLFTPPHEGLPMQKASRYLRLHRRQVMNAVCSWTNEKKYRVDLLLAKLIDRCDKLQLHVRTDTLSLNLQVAAYVTSLVMNHLLTGRFKRTKS